jgi:hypothetical protein
MYLGLRVATKCDISGVLTHIRERAPTRKEALSLEDMMTQSAVVSQPSSSAVTVLTHGCREHGCGGREA